METDKKAGDRKTARKAKVFMNPVFSMILGKNERANSIF